MQHTTNMKPKIPMPDWWSKASLTKQEKAIKFWGLSRVYNGVSNDAYSFGDACDILNDVMRAVPDTVVAKRAEVLLDAMIVSPRKKKLKFVTTTKLTKVVLL